MGFWDWFKRESKQVKENKASAARLGWTPKWFSSNAFNEDLVRKVKKFQLANRLQPTGVVDTSTYRRKITERDAVEAVFSSMNSNSIICNGQYVKLNWNKVVTFAQDNHWSLPETNYRKHNGIRHPGIFLVHWDVCLSSKRCHEVLKKRGISVHFFIDNDGTIYQSMDTRHIAWHAGIRKVNDASIGVEISNAYYPKYQNTYQLKGFGERPIITGAQVHGAPLEPFLGFYPVQLQALKALYAGLHKAHGIPFDYPKNADGEMKTTISPSVVSTMHRGVASHFHATKRKIDCAGLDLKEIAEGASKLV